MDKKHQCSHKPDVAPDKSAICERCFPTDNDVYVMNESSGGKIRDPRISAIWSLVFIGLGQFYNGRTRDGMSLWFGLLAIVIASLALPSLAEFFVYVVIGGWTYGVYEAYCTAQRINREEIPFRGESQWFFRSLVLILSSCCALFVYWLFSMLM